MAPSRAAAGAPGWDPVVQEPEYLDESPPRYPRAHRRLLTGTDVPPRLDSPSISDPPGSSSSRGQHPSRQVRERNSAETIHINSAPLHPLPPGLGTYHNLSTASLPMTEPVGPPGRSGQSQSWQAHADDWTSQPSESGSGAAPYAPVHASSDYRPEYQSEYQARTEYTGDGYGPEDYPDEYPDGYSADYPPESWQHTSDRQPGDGSQLRPLPPMPAHNFGADPQLARYDYGDVQIDMPEQWDGGDGAGDGHAGGDARSQVSGASWDSDKSPPSAYGHGEYDEEKENGPDSAGMRRRLPEQPNGEGSADGFDTALSRHGPTRQAQMEKKQVKLVNGKLVLDCNIPSVLYSFLPRRDAAEFTQMRYTAVTCDPDDFISRGYRLRQQLGPRPRETELLICVTMYNEDELHFTRTMHGVMQNISHFCSRARSRIWGRDGWQKIVVCIIADGRSRVHPRTLDGLAALGVYQAGIAKNRVNRKQVKAHLYEYTTQVSLDSDLRFKGAEKGIVPCQLVFCLKEQNLKKLNSHRWFFNVFGRALKPNVCILLDVGTRPAPTALYHLWKAFDLDSNVAGAAGEIVAGKGRRWKGLLNPLVASQNFEYKMSNILDKPLESVFGYITVLPGALSAYRYHALMNDETGHGPLSQYFKGETLHGQDADVFTANMYLAEDRILCWELVAKRSDRWLLKYVSSAKGETDVPDTVPEFISQRRRWLNGAFFAAVYSLLHFRQVWKTDHSLGRKILLHIEFVYQAIQLLFTYLSLANFYLTFYFIAGSLAEPQTDPFGHGIANVIYIILRYTCVLLICLQFILSMGNRPQGAHKMFFFSMVGYAIIMVYTIFCGLYITIKQLRDHSIGVKLGANVFTNMIVSTLSTVGLYFIMSFLYLDPWHMFTSSAQYFLLLPSYICTLQIYAFCNAHDVSWGTKGDNGTQNDLGAAQGTNKVVVMDMPSEQLDIDSGYDDALRNLRDRIESPPSPVNETQQQEDYYRAVRTYMVVVWLFANAVLAMSVSEAYGGRSIGNNFYLTFILWSVAGLALFRALGSTAFGVLNIIHAIAEWRLKWHQRRSGNGGTNGSAVGSGVTSGSDGGPSAMAGPASALGSGIEGKKSTLSSSSAYARARYGQGAKVGIVTKMKDGATGLFDKMRRRE